MKFSTCASVLAGAALLTPISAAPRPPKILSGPAWEEALKQRLKYFHEPGEGNALGHYDSRFYHGIVTDEERTETQLHMIRAYLDFFRTHGLDTWIAHGTLLGWWWNGKRLPWDWDLDTQVSAATLFYMGKTYNQTRHTYVPENSTQQREYLLDVNPYITDRERGNGLNIIDARWIDTSNGLYVDITGLSETKPMQAPGIWTCKNYHRYSTAELFPMRETIFEGVVAKVPYSYDKILVDEYAERALTITRFEGHQWNPQQKLWLKTPERKASDERLAAERLRIENERKIIEEHQKKSDAA